MSACTVTYLFPARKVCLRTWQRIDGGRRYVDPDRFRNNRMNMWQIRKEENDDEDGGARVSERKLAVNVADITP